jgi:hypothetical protein
MKPIQGNSRWAMEARCGTVFRIFPVKLARLDPQVPRGPQGQQALRGQRLAQEQRGRRVRLEMWGPRVQQVRLVQRARLRDPQVQRVRLGVWEPQGLPVRLAAQGQWAPQVLLVGMEL